MDDDVIHPLIGISKGFVKWIRFEEHRDTATVDSHLKTAI